MSDTLGFVSLKDVTMKAIHRNRLPLSEYKLIISLVIDGCKDLSLFTIQGSKTKRIKMSPVNTIDLPQDYLSFISIGVPYNGRIWTFTQDRMIVSPSSLSNGVEVLNNDKGEGILRGTSSRTSYNAKGGQNQYYYKIEEENNRIIIEGLPRAEVTLTYKSSGVSTNGETLVPSIAEEALLCWVDWKKSKAERVMNWTLKSESDYYDECNKIKYLQSCTLDVLYDTLYSTYSQGIKR